jgi:hypothetical protein
MGTKLTQIAYITREKALPAEEKALPADKKNTASAW